MDKRKEKYVHPKFWNLPEKADDLKIVGKIMGNWKLNHQFNEKNVPLIFQTIINKKINNLKKIRFYIQDEFTEMAFGDVEVLLEKKGNDWVISYERGGETFKTDNPDISIVDHLWFVLKNPKLKLEDFQINHSECKKDPEMMGLKLQSMFDSLDHQVHISEFSLFGFHENVLWSSLPRMKPGVLQKIFFNIPWKKEGNYPKLKEIIKMDQWKHAKEIHSSGMSPLKIEDVLHCQMALLVLSLKDVLRTKKKFFNATNSKKYSLHDKNSGPMMEYVQGISKLDAFDAKSKSCYKINKIERSLILIDPHDSIILHQL